jgi:hypothetical protein
MWRATTAHSSPNLESAATHGNGRPLDSDGEAYSTNDDRNPHDRERAGLSSIPTLRNHDPLSVSNERGRVWRGVGSAYRRNRGVDGGL